MGKRYASVSTDGYQTSEANEDILETLINSLGWSVGSIPSKKTEIYVKDDLKFIINGVYEKTLLAGMEQEVIEEIYSLTTVTPDVEFYVSFEF